MSDAPDPSPPPPQPATPLSSAPPISYERPTALVPLRTLRLLMALTLLNTILLGGYVLGPGLSGYFQRQWTAWKESRVAKKAAAAQAPRRNAAMKTEAPALTFTRPPDMLVYDHNPARKANSATTSPATWPSVVPTPKEFTALPRVIPGWGLLQDPTYTLIYMHERRVAPGEPPRLVLVFLDSDPPLYRDGGTRYRDPTIRGFLALTIEPTGPDGDIRASAYASYRWSAPSPNSVLRLYAGQSDPIDPSRFRIAYEVDGASGVIVGRLRPDERVELIADEPLSKGWSSRTSSAKP